MTAGYYTDFIVLVIADLEVRQAALTGSAMQK